MIFFHKRVAVRAADAQGVAYYVHAAEAERMFRSGQAVFELRERRIHVQDEASIGHRKKVHVSELLLLDANPDPQKSIGANSLKSTFTETVPVLRAGRPVVARITQHKKIRRSLLPIYCTAVLETLVPSESLDTLVPS